MWAAAEYAETREGQPPYELMLAWQIERWGASAIFGSEPAPINLLLRMTVAMNIYEACEGYKQGSANIAQWARMNPKQFEIIAALRKMRQDA